MNIVIDAATVLRAWPNVEKYQNTTLRYTPNTDFPEVMEEIIGKPDIIRLFVTLDEVWDYRTNEYHWNYLIGENRYVGDNKHYEYDWPLTEVSPFQVHEEDYLRSHAAHAKTVMLNIRRYEREIIEGIITLETYEKVFEKVVEYYKEHIANIVYIECCNEVEIPRFGGLRMEEYYPLYQCASRAIARLNAKHSYEQPLQIGGFGMSAGMSNWKYWDAFMRLLAKDEKRKIDYYSMHEYHGNPCRILEFYIRHEELRKEFNLPELPLMMSEYGMRYGLGDAGRPDNLHNASGEVAGMLLGSYCKNLKMFPWCSFHNPNQQLGRTMFLQMEDTYIPTPSGHVMTMFHWLKPWQLIVEEDTENQIIATKDKDSYAIMAANPLEDKREYHFLLKHIKKADYIMKEYYVDAFHNNCLQDKSCMKLSISRETKFQNVDKITFTREMNPTSVHFYTIEKRK